MLKDSFSSASVFMGLSLLLLALVLFGASQGALKISFSALLDEEYRDIWLNIRLPRVLLAVLVGAALATAGVIMQGLFRNPMADPGLLGVSSGSALMVGVAIVLPFSFPVVLVLYEQMVFAIAGSLVVCTVIFLITQRHRDGSMMQLLLAGIAINTLCGHVVDDGQSRSGAMADIIGRQFIHSASHYGNNLSRRDAEFAATW